MDLPATKTKQAAQMYKNKLLWLITLTFIISLSLTNISPALAACGSNTTPFEGTPPPPEEPMVVPPGPSEDENWPIVKEWTEKATNKRGQAIVSAYVVRRNPNAQVESEVTTAANYCTYVGTYSLTSTHTIQGITQYLKSYYDEHNIAFLGNHRGYWIYKTEEWWKRTSTVYTVGRNSTNWTDNGWNCSWTYSQNSGSGAVTPTWANSTETYHYIYTTTTSGWPIKTPGTVPEGLIKTRETAPAYKSGQSIGTLTTEVRLYGN